MQSKNSGMRTFAMALGLAALVLALISPPALAQKRVALLVGNNAYQNVPALRAASTRRLSQAAPSPHPFIPKWCKNRTRGVTRSIRHRHAAGQPAAISRVLPTENLLVGNPACAAIRFPCVRFRQFRGLVQ